MKNNRYALTLIIGIFMCLFSNRAMSQIAVSADPTTCGDTSVTIHGLMTGSVPVSAGITADDGYSGLINIGFSFTFYGNTYTQLVIGSNGVLNFNAGSAGSGMGWSITSQLLGNTTVRNCICGPWSDICTPCATPGGTITYSTVGTAPYRKFVATWCSTKMYGCTTQYETFQIIIYETTNIAETHIAHRTLGCTWNGGYAIVGVQNATGTAATAAPGRDYPSLWGATNEAWQFAPTGSPITSYSVSSIPFAPVPYSSSTIYWYDSATWTLVGSGPTLNVTPTVPTTYVATAAGCGDSTFAYLHVMPASGGSVGGISHPVHINDSITITNPTECGSHDGTITLHGVNPFYVDTIFYSIDGVPQPNLIGAAASDSSLVITNLPGSGLPSGYYDYIYVKEGTCVSNSVSLRLAGPILVPVFTYTTRLGCEGDSVIISNASYTLDTIHNALVATPNTYNYTSAFTFNDGGTASGAGLYSPMHIYTVPGTYNIDMHYTNVYGCDTLYSLPVTLGHPLIPAFSPSAPAVCLGLPITFNNATVAGGPTYFWSFGDGATSTDVNPIHSYVAPGDYTVHMMVTDNIPCSATIDTVVTVVSIETRAEFHDSTVCLRLPLLLNSYTQVAPASLTNVVYQWTPATDLSDPTSPNPYFMGVGEYSYTLTATVLPLGCTATDIVDIHSKPPLVLTHVTVDQTVPIGSSVQLNADSAWVYVWTPNNGTLTNPNINNPIATPTDSVTTYMVVGMSPYGCRDSATVTIRVDPTVTEFIPMAFTPNGDGLNDMFRAYNIGDYQKLVDFRIFNRWGHEVFHTINAKQGWDGTMNGEPQDMGTYFYQIIVATPDGQQKSVSGNVTLIR